MRTETLGVVPIVMSAGAAVLPTIVAAATSVLAIVLRPRELVRICVRHPWRTLIALVVVTSLILGTFAFSTAKSASRTSGHTTASGTRFDWAKVAEDLLAQEATGRVPTVPGAAASLNPIDPPPTPVSHTTATALITDNTRSLFDGGPSPRQLKPLWHFRPDDTMFLSMPALAGSRIFVAGCQSDLGGYTGLLACIDAQTGKPLWQITELNQEVLRPFFSSPALTVDGKYMVIGQGLHEDHDCSLLCFETATGKLHWAVKTTLHIESSPAIFGDLAVVGAGAIEGKDGKPTGDPGYVFGVRISDGKELWRHAVNDPESSPAIDQDGMVYIGSGFNGNAVAAIRSDSDDALKEKKLNRLAWKTAVAQPVTGTVTLVGDLVIVGAGNGDFVHSSQSAQGLVVAFDKKTGAIRWQTPLNDSVLGSIAARDGLLICPSRSGEVIALALETGKVLWRSRVSGSAPILAGCAFTGKSVYAVSSDGYLALLNAKDGTLQEKISLNDQARPGSGLTGCSPQVIDSRVIVGSETGGVQCLVGTGGGQ